MKGVQQFLKAPENIKESRMLTEMDDHKLVKLAVDYKQASKRSMGRSLKRWLQLEKIELTMY